MRLEKLLSDYSRLSGDKLQEQILEDGKKAYGLLVKAFLEKGLQEKDAAELAVMILRLVCDLDNHASEAEYNLFRAATGIELDKNEFFALMKNGFDQKSLDLLNEVVDSLDPTSKEAALRLAAIFLAQDQKLSEKELKAFKLLED